MKKLLDAVGAVVLFLVICIALFFMFMPWG